MAAPPDGASWVIVAGGFHQRGGMDRANAALARHLLDSRIPVHLVGHEIDPCLAAHALATVHVVPRPRGLPGLAERLLARRGTAVAGAAVASDPGTRVVVNGGNCPWPDVNWVHAVHAVWPVHDAGAPWWSRYRNQRLKQLAIRREREALGLARVVVANSEFTRRAVIERVGVAAERTRTVYLGSDPAWGPALPGERAAARAELGLPPDAPVVVFVGALGTDAHKGFDVLWRAWTQLAGSTAWDARLVVAGGGWRVPRLQAEAQASGAAASVQFLGFTPRVRELLAAGDLLVSPVRYEAYGLNVHEALCRGLAAMVTRTAGVAERFDRGMADALLPEDVDAAELAHRLRAWRGDMAGWRARAAATAARLRSRSWMDMAADFVDLVQRSAQRASA